MKRTTDMKKIIETAEHLVDKDLVWKDAGWGGHGPVMNVHPIWWNFDGEVCVYANNCVALRVDPNNLAEFEEAKEKVKEWFRACKSVRDVLRYIRESYYEDFIEEIKDMMSVDDLSKLIYSLWELPNKKEFRLLFSKDFFLEMFDTINLKAFMDDREYSTFESLHNSGKEIELFRGWGTDSDDSVGVEGSFSWALDEDELIEVGVWGRLGDINSAEDGEHEDARIYHAFIKGEDILAIYMGGSYTEAIVNPDKVYGVEAIGHFEWED